MKAISWLVVVFAATTTETITFDSTAAGRMPAGWRETMTRPGSRVAGPKWEVVKDPTAPSPPNVLAQVSSDSTSGRYPMAILEKSNFKDGEVSVRIKPVAGKEDQAAGLVWRYRDENNYYLVRANALENNIVLYKVEGGKRTALAPKGKPPTTYGVKHEVPHNMWSTLKVTCRGYLFSVYFNHRRIFQVEDSTFAGPGKVGLWTKADSVSYFDDLRVVQK